MDSHDVQEFQRRLVSLSELFDKKLSAPSQMLYFEALRDLDFSAVARAMNAAVQSSTFMPKPAELRKLAVGDSEDRIEQAWLLLKDAMRTIGSYASLATADPALGEAITAVFGGWPEACQADFSPEMWASKRKEFGRTYRALVDRGLVGTRYLLGQCEQTNGRRAEWMRFVPVGLIEGTAVKQLSGAETEAYRQQLAGQAHGFARLEASLEQVLPVQQQERA